MFCSRNSQTQNPYFGGVEEEEATASTEVGKPLQLIFMSEEVIVICFDLVRWYLVFGSVEPAKEQKALQLAQILCVWISL